MNLITGSRLEFRRPLDASNWSSPGTMINSWQQAMIPVPGPGVYRLTWKANKSLAASASDEDFIFLENIEFHYQ